MDLLPSLTGKSMLEQTPYVGGDLRWDSGAFLHYACRRGWLANVPLHLRKCDCQVPWRDRPYFSPVQQSEKETFLQTWLFFGLLAEFYGLNDDPSGDGAAHAAHRQAETADTASDSGRTAEIEALYAAFVKATPDIDGEGQSAGKYVTGAALDSPQSAEKIAHHFMQKQAGDNARLASYFNYLYECLHFVNKMVSHLDTSTIDFRQSISVPIAALGELCTTILQVLAQAFAIPHDAGGIWGVHYLKFGGDVEAKMLRQRWCRSDVERIRQSFNGLATRHFLSSLEKPPTQSYNHDACGLHVCRAGQIDPKTYKLTHTQDCDGCEIISVNQKEVKDILTNSKTFPVLRLDLEEGNGGRVVNIDVEAYTKDKPYVALSHVWADGLGNQKANALQLCQVDRLAQLIRDLPALVSRAGDETANQATAEKRPAYWFWIDTLCCPIDLQEKRIALARIAAVYREATHVLVLDESISHFVSEGDGPTKAAENCLRILGSANWMRRLWTLQEGSLATSLYFQFRDKAISLSKEAARLSEFGLRDIRYKCISDNVHVEVTSRSHGIESRLGYNLSYLTPHDLKQLHRLTSLCKVPTHPTPSVQGRAIEGSLFQLRNLQSCLYFRNVSVASDEPLCVATLLSLDPAAITGEGCRQERMAKIWKMVAQRSGGRFTARVIFYNDQPLGLASLRGWRWAPKSLLPELETGLRYGIANIRFGPPDSAAEIGAVTEDGLRVVLPGMRIALLPWRDHASGRVWPWSLVTRHLVESSLFCRDETGRWFELADQIRGNRISGWSWEEWAARDEQLLKRDQEQPWEGRRPSQPIFNELCRGELALIRDTKFPGPIPVYLLARLQAPYVEGAPLYVHACLPVSMSEVPASLWPGLDILRGVAAEVYDSEINQELLRFLEGQQGAADPDADGEECKRIIKDLRGKMQQVARAALDKDEDGLLERVSQEFMGDGKRADVWKTLLFHVPYNLSAQSLSDDQVWVVDGPVVGNGLCQDACCGGV